ncbi:MAG: hypothetical protein D6719_12450 [Candidatus Dadabacteria bacterium]|nr:MAG: hypothetical protein D6719_12450 [Candidatus Dadabacteria bacterium]
MIAGSLFRGKVTKSGLNRTIDFSFFLFLVSLYLLCIFGTAWIGDDAYITLRTVDNFLHGYGLRWNTTERVQAFTHPLWLFLLILSNGISGEEYFSTITLSIIVSLAALVVFLYNAKNLRARVVGLLVLSFSAAYMDYSTSGLENPLTHLILILFFARYIQKDKSDRRFLILSGLAGLAALNRLDTILFYIPALLIEFWKSRNLKAIADGLIGFTPLLAWHIFAFFYYGSTPPNTAYAKLNTGLGLWQLLPHGICYLFNSLVYDTVTPLIILAGVFAGWRLSGCFRAIATGIFMYLCYTVSIGGDFMSGRFLAAPLLLSVFVLSQFKWEKTARYYLYLIMIIASTFFSGPAHNLSWIYQQNATPETRQLMGIVDERRYYLKQGSLLSRLKNNLSELKVADYAEQATHLQQPIVYKAIGYFGFLAGPSVHVIDPLALADPFLSRLPVRQDVPFRVGHYLRLVPDEYITAVESGGDNFKDARLKKFYEGIKLKTQAELFSSARLKYLLRKLVRGQETPPEQEYFMYPIHLKLKLAECKKGRLISAAGVEILLPENASFSEFSAEFGANDTYRVDFFNATGGIATEIIHPVALDAAGTLRREVKVEQRGSLPLDHILIIPLEGDGHYEIAGCEIKS